MVSSEKKAKFKGFKIFKSSLETTYNETSQFVEKSYEVTDPRTL